jgi:hypothetical protein
LPSQHTLHSRQEAVRAVWTRRRRQLA